MDKVKIDTIDELFNFYQSYKDIESGSEYLLNFNGRIVHINTSLFNLQQGVIDKEKKIITDYAIKRFHPNHIDNKEFWVKARTNYPLVSICANMSENVSECNEKTLKIAKDDGVLDYIDDFYHKHKRLNILEIGYGECNFYHYLNDKYKVGVNYIGIDYYKNDVFCEYDELRVIEQSGIPSDIEDESLDIIYSYNVLQHCSQKDRNDYFLQSYSKLKKNGVFLGSMHIETPENKNESYLGIKDDNGRKYSGFFNQFTEIDTVQEFRGFVENIGYEVSIKNIVKGYYSFILIKK